MDVCLVIVAALFISLPPPGPAESKLPLRSKTMGNYLRMLEYLNNQMTEKRDLSMKHKRHSDEPHLNKIALKTFDIDPKYNRTTEKALYDKSVDTLSTTTATDRTSSRLAFMPGQARYRRNNTLLRYPPYYPEKLNRKEALNRSLLYSDNKTITRDKSRGIISLNKPTENKIHRNIYRPIYPGRDYVRNPREANNNEDVPRRYPSYLRRTTTTIPTPPPDMPNRCDMSYDAITLIRGELFIFKDKYCWRIGETGFYPQYPIEFSKLWTALPESVTHVDAVYERPDHGVAIFIGKQLYLFDAIYLKPGYPKSLVELGLPQNLKKIDAAVVWGHNGKTYFFSGTHFWRFDEEVQRVELDYPRDMSMWKGVGYNIDSVFQWKDGTTYFFKGKGFWKFDDMRMRVEHVQQTPSAQFWMSCPDQPKYLVQWSIENICRNTSDISPCYDKCCTVMIRFESKLYHDIEKSHTSTASAPSGNVVIES